MDFDNLSFDHKISEVWSKDCFISQIQTLRFSYMILPLPKLVSFLYRLNLNMIWHKWYMLMSLNHLVRKMIKKSQPFKKKYLTKDWAWITI